MKFRINTRDEMSRSEKRYRAAKWLIYTLLLLMCTVIMRSGVFGNWQPVLLIPLAVAVSMYEDELSSCIFALFCGYMTDIGFGFLFGFSAVWLMAVCVLSSLLVRNLIRVNLINFCIISAAAVMLEFSMDYFFNVFLWNIPKGEIILMRSILPTAIATMIVSPALYFLTRLVVRRLGSESVDVIYPDEQPEEAEGDDEQ